MQVRRAPLRCDVRRVLGFFVLSVLFGSLATISVGARQLPFIGALDATRQIPYFVADGDGISGHQSGDGALARWALAAWQRAADGALELTAGTERSALIRLHWVPPSGSLYGEMRPILVDGRRGAIIFVMPDTDHLGPEIAARARRDPLFRDTVVYLTCLHELGHGFGLEHTADYDDIMYFFGHGGDIPAYFQRYRDQVQARDDIQRVSGLSADDVQRLRALYGGSDGGF